MPPTYRAVGRRRLPEEIVDQIETLIVNSELRVGDPLPPERELARQLQVSRSALREAIGMLAQKGLVQVRPGSGTYVAQPTATFIADTLHLFLRLNPDLLLDFIESRIAIETETAAMAAERATARSIQALEKTVDDMNVYRDEPDRYVEGDLAFHIELARATGNQVLVLLITSLRAALRENIRYFVSHPEVIERSLRYHRQIYEAVAAHQPDAARAAMRLHFGHIVDGLRSGLLVSPPTAHANTPIEERQHVVNAMAN